MEDFHDKLAILKIKSWPRQLPTLKMDIFFIIIVCLVHLNGETGLSEDTGLQRTIGYYFTWK